MSKNDTAPSSDFTGVRAKLAAHKDAHAGTYEKTLPQSEIKVQIPKFMAHQHWMSAQRQAKGDLPKAQAAYVMKAVRFEGEQLTMADVQAGLIDGKDMLFLIGEAFGDEDDDAADDGGGNAPKDQAAD